MHWSDVVAQRLAQSGKRHIIASGITPSGEFHIGHLREILTGDMIVRAARKIGLDAELVFIIDNADPLRKVYPFLSADYHQFIGHQLQSIPAPDEQGNPNWKRFHEEGWSYGDHFLEPFLEALTQIGVHPRLLRNLESYRTGKFAESARLACDNPHILREIIERISGRELDEGWFPWQPLDSKGSLDGVTITNYAFPLVSWKDKHGVEGVSDISKGEGKLPWRLDWAARWGFHSITCEPFGKDHGAAGGSYDTGIEIARFFGHEPPEPLMYEWISLRGQGQMHSSTGNTIGPIEALQLVPPEILRFLIANSKPNKPIEFDTGMGLVNLADEFERWSIRNLEQEMQDSSLSRRQMVQLEDMAAALSLATVRPEQTAGSAFVSFRHLALLAQIKSSDEEVWESLQQTHGLKQLNEQLQDRLKRMRFWIDSSHFPSELRVSILDSPKHSALQALSSQQKTIVKIMGSHFKSSPWTAEGITSALKNTSVQCGAEMKDVYRAAYSVFMGEENGPRLGPILSHCEQSKMIDLLDQCAQLV